MRKGFTKFLTLLAALTVSIGMWGAEETLTWAYSGIQAACTDPSGITMSSSNGSSTIASSMAASFSNIKTKGESSLTGFSYRLQSTSGTYLGVKASKTIDENQYVEATFTVPTGYVFKLKTISFPFCAKSTSISARLTISDADTEVTPSDQTASSNNSATISYSDALMSEELSGNVTVKIWFWMPSSTSTGKYAGLGDLAITGDLASSCETSITTQPSDAILAIGDANPELSVVATNAQSYAWKESSDGTSYDGASALATTASYTPSVNDAVQTKYYYCEVTSSCDGSTVVKSDIVTVDVKASIANYTVSLDPNGGTIDDATGWTLNGSNYEKTVSEGTELTLPTFTKDSRTFKTWRQSSVDYASPITVNADMSLTAIWTAAAQSVAYYWEGAEGGATEFGGTATHYNADTPDGDNTRVNYKNTTNGVDYYTICLNGKTDYSTDHIRIALGQNVKTGDVINMVAYYSKDGTKTVAPKIANSSNTELVTGTTPPNIYSSGSPELQSVTLPADFEGSELRFTRSTTATNVFITKLQIISNDAVEEDQLRTITFDADGGSSVADVVVANGKRAVKPADPTKTNAIFEGWYNGGSLYDWTTAVTADLALTAHWTQMYNVTYTSEHGTAPAAVEGVSQVALTALEADGYAFQGWTADQDVTVGGEAKTAGTVLAAGATAVLSANTTFTAQWAQAFTVTYYNGSTALGTEQVVSGGNPANYATYQAIDHYDFVEWKNSSDAAVTIASEVITADANYYGSWTANYATTIDFTTYVAETQLTTSLADVLAADNDAYTCGGTFNNSEWGTTAEDDAYQGYKFKDNGVYIEFLLQSGKRATFLFGNYGSTGTIKIGSADAVECTLTDNQYVVNASEDVVVRFTTGGTGTVTMKSITIADQPAVSDDVTLSDLKIDGTTATDFEASKTIYYRYVDYGTATSAMPKITEVTPNHTNATAGTIQNIQYISEGGYYLSQVKITAEDGENYQWYQVRTFVQPKQGVSLIKATHTSGSKTEATVTGYIGGTYDKSTQTNGKLGSTGHYFGVQLASGNFQSGDVVKVVASALNGGNTATLYADNAGTTAIGDAAFDANTLTAYYTLTAEVEKVYLYRASSACNPNVDYIEVQRYMDPFIQSFTLAGETGTISGTNITVEVPASTDLTSLTPTIVAWANGSATIDKSGAQDFSSAQTYTVSSAYAEDTPTEYTITVTKETASSDATLSALAVAGNTLVPAFDPAVTEYSVELPYGTLISSLPEVTYTVNHSGATAVKTDATALPGATTIVVTAEDATAKTYTINFTVSNWQNIAIWDGSTMDAVATSPDATTGLAWTVTGFKTIAEYECSCGSKAYTKVLPSGGSASDSRNIAVVVPEGYVAKFYVTFATHSDGDERGMFIGTAATKTVDESSVLELYSSSRASLTGGTSEPVGAGTYYINPMASVDFGEIRVLLRSGMVRTEMLGNGVLGTSCVKYNVALEDIEGATFYELNGKNTDGKIVFDEIVSGDLEAGNPYVFQASGDRLVLYYGTTSVENPVDNGNGMYGTFTAITITELTDVYYFAQKALWSCSDLTELSVPANRAYVKLSEIPDATTSPAPGRRRITLGVNGAQVATDIEQTSQELRAKSQKILIDGQLFILRGEKLYDATGRMVK